MEHRKLVTKAKRIARKAHEGQYDFMGHTIYDHVLRVYKAIPKEDKEARLVALLHDVVEDSELTIEDLASEGFPEPVLEAVDLLTKRPKDPYMRYIKRIAKHPLARRVKIADLADNTHPSRVDPLPEKVKLRFSKRHLPAKEFLNDG